MADSKRQLPWFQLMANIYFYVTDHGSLRPRGEMSWPAKSNVKATRTIRLARIAHDGNANPEPAAWQRIALIMGAQGTRLEVSEPTDPAELDASAWPIAHMTGTEDFKLSDKQKDGLTKYLKSGGTLIVDAAGGSREFNAAARREVLGLLGTGPTMMSAAHPIFDKLKLTWRRSFGISLGSQSQDIRLRALVDGDRPVIIYSPDDITAGMTGYEHSGISGYSVRSATELMTSILNYVSKQAETTGSDTKPAVEAS